MNKIVLSDLNITIIYTLTQCTVHTNMFKYLLNITFIDLILDLLVFELELPSSHKNWEDFKKVLIGIWSTAYDGILMQFLKLSTSFYLSRCRPNVHYCLLSAVKSSLTLFKFSAWNMFCLLLWRCSLGVGPFWSYLLASMAIAWRLQVGLVMAMFQSRVEQITLERY